MEQDNLHAQNRFLHQQLEAHKQAIIKLEAEKARLSEMLAELVAQAAGEGVDAE